MSAKETRPEDSGAGIDDAGLAGVSESQASVPAAAASWGLRRGRELDAFLGADDEEPPYDWLIPGLLERRDRVILTGGEGHGKSTLARQIGIQVASGIHPFGGDDFAPGRVMLLDLENSERQLRRELRPLRAAAGKRYAGAMHVEVRLEGLNLLDPDDGEWFKALIKGYEPDLLITGPAYKMHAGDPNEEGAARVVSSYLDWARSEHGSRCAVWLEAHSPHGTNGQRRPERPYGASLWLRWPEFGLHVSATGQLRHWRGARDADRQWPAALERGGEWPWTPAAQQTDAETAVVADRVLREEEDKVVAAIAQCVAYGKPPNKSNVREATPIGSKRTDAALVRLKQSGRVSEVPGARNARVFTLTQDQIPGV